MLECLDSEGNWIDLRLCHAQDFGRLADGTYVHSTGGSPLFLRCLRQDGRVIYVVDGGGDPYRIVSLPSRASATALRNQPEARLRRHVTRGASAFRDAEDPARIQPRGLANL